MHTDRRKFLGLTGVAFSAVLAAGCSTTGRSALATASANRFGPLQPDPAGVLDLPEGFSYRVISRLGDMMDDGEGVPDAADGMGCFDLGNGKISLVRNHELRPDRAAPVAVSPAFDTVQRSLLALPGGTTTIILDAETLEVERQYRSLAGTIRNCAGGVTPWNTWLTCEENTSRADGRINQDHGWVFEVPADSGGLVDPVPLRAMGRFNHEAACVDPASGMVYLTEDRDDSILYRFIPAERGNLAAGGTLQALVIAGVADTRNQSGAAMAARTAYAGTWITLDNVEAPEDDLRLRGAAAGAAVFARGEGIWMGEGEMYFTATSGGAAGEGQIFRLAPRTNGPDMVELFYESPAQSEFSYGDNLTVAPFGDLIVCEDQYSDTVDNYLRGITPAGEAYAFGRLRIQTEPAGACFSPDGRTLFVNAYAPTMTLAITGPWPTA
ncbi:alkaline phosphatase PhoX [Erythrobacter sp. EC-HK427]|uniref:alkaline phosphatase PhoX n=1 Tax=Erythrobacter sp. EC-HK427 TaxID=2038396 RepID=UPI001259B50F|nr:alkaline phosphatase PhoX [Erythrobacter sp. EC-HK427]VVT07573.1 Phosphatase [Erythrobacter sp. EC-HK427]